MNLIVKRMLIIAGWLLGVTIVAAALVYCWAWKSPPYYPLSAQAPAATGFVPFRDYPAIANHPRPYVLQGAGYVVFGATHSRDPRAPEFALLEQAWQQLHPTVALVEGRLGFLLPPFMDPVATLGEGGKVKALARSAGVSVYNWDLPKEQLAKQLTARFSAEQVALAQILQPYFSKLRFGRPTDPTATLSEYLPRAAYVGQQANFRSVTDVDRVWHRYFPQGPDWRVTSDEQALPGYLAEVQITSNDLRNARLLGIIRELRSRGERVFVCCGSSHAACLAPALAQPTQASR